MEEKINDNEKLREEETETPANSKWPLQAKIIICCLIILIIGLIIFIVILSISKSDKKENKNNGEEDEDDHEEDSQREIYEKAGYIEPWNDLYGIRKANLSYIKEDKIVNSFREGGDNYNESIGEINGGKDYPKNERNVYTLYIPYSSLYKKDEYNGIFLYIHGGSWTGGNKEDIEFLCSRYAKMGYITATMGYTVLSGEYEQYNIYRILDEINACIESIKEELEGMGFNSSKLEMAIGGVSAGAHITLLYGYTIKKTPIKLKFLVNIVGPLSLEPEFWYKPSKNNQTTDDLEKETVDKAIQEGKFIPIFEDRVFIGLMNGFLGNLYNEEDTKEMIVDNKINKESAKYQEMFKKVQNSFPIKFVDNNTLPTLCEYAGNDSLVGVAMYKFLKEASKKYGNQLDLVYMKYAGHELVSYNTENGIKAMRDIHYQVLNYASKYFTHQMRNNTD